MDYLFDTLTELNENSQVPHASRVVEATDH